MKSFSNKNSSDNHKKKFKNNANKKNYSKSGWLSDQTSTPHQNNRMVNQNLIKIKLIYQIKKIKEQIFLEFNSKNSHTGLKNEPTSI